MQKKVIFWNDKKTKLLIKKYPIQDLICIVLFFFCLHWSETTHNELEK